jgi:hypothetical protein
VGKILHQGERGNPCNDSGVLDWADVCYSFGGKINLVSRSITFTNKEKNPKHLLVAQTFHGTVVNVSITTRMSSELTLYLTYNAGGTKV